MGSKNICVGTGLVALDVILNGKPETLPKLTAGGSCGNVLTILSFLGWNSYPIARFANNTAAREVENDLKKWSVETKLISKTKDGSTPIIIHRILTGKDGKPKHRFEFRDPDTKKWLPQYKPVLNKSVPGIIEKESFKTTVFYFDRINRASVELAKHYKRLGSIVFFEPSSVPPNLPLFRECLETSDILKFSNERIKNYTSVFKKQQVPLEIETMGSEGIRFRFSRIKEAKAWHNIEAFKIDLAVDSAGAGDWCSSGIISSICRNTKSGLHDLTLKQIRSSLEFGQALAALNCCFDGARGSMYNLSKTQVLNAAKRILTGKRFDPTTLKPVPKLEGKNLKIIELST